MFEATLLDRASRLLAQCQAARLRLATAESCTGGLIAGLLTEIPGSSAVVDRGFVTYSNEAKQALLGVSPDLLRRRGAVSAEVARAMALGAATRSEAAVAVAVTGIAGPGGGSASKPVGLVHFGLSIRDGETWSVERRFGDLGRSEVRLATVAEAVALLEAAVGRVTAVRGQAPTEPR